MSDHDDARIDLEVGDEALPAAGRRRREVLSHPVVIGLLAVAVAAALFGMGYSIGETAYGAFAGEGLTAAAFGGTLVAVLVAIVAVGVVLDRRQRTRDARSGALTDHQRERLQSYIQPTPTWVRWYQPVAVAAFIALAAPGVMLLDTPWASLWVLAALVANPVARWLRAQAHVLTTRDLGFSVPGLSPWPATALAGLAAATGMAVAVPCGPTRSTPPWPRPSPAPWSSRSSWVAASRSTTTAADTSPVCCETGEHHPGSTGRDWTAEAPWPAIDRLRELGD